MSSHETDQTASKSATGGSKRGPTLQVETNARDTKMVEVQPDPDLEVALSLSPQWLTGRKSGSQNKEAGAPASRQPPKDGKIRYTRDDLLAMFRPSDGYPEGFTVWSSVSSERCLEPVAFSRDSGSHRTGLSGATDEFGRGRGATRGRGRGGVAPLAPGVGRGAGRGGFGRGDSRYSRRGDEGEELGGDQEPSPDTTGPERVGSVVGTYSRTSWRNASATGKEGEERRGVYTRTAGVGFSRSRPSADDLGLGEERSGTSPVSETPMSGFEGAETDKAEAPEAQNEEQFDASHVDEHTCWVYKNDRGEVQGPFSLEKLREWHDAGFFADDLRVRKVGPAAATPEDAAYRPLSSVLADQSAPQRQAPEQPDVSAAKFAAVDPSILANLTSPQPAGSAAFSVEAEERGQTSPLSELNEQSEIHIPAPPRGMVMPPFLAARSPLMPGGFLGQGPQSPLEPSQQGFVQQQQSPMDINPLSFIMSLSQQQQQQQAHFQQLMQAQGAFGLPSPLAGQQAPPHLPNYMSLLSMMSGSPIPGVQPPMFPPAFSPAMSPLHAMGMGEGGQGLPSAQQMLAFQQAQAQAIAAAVHAQQQQQNALLLQQQQQMLAQQQQMFQQQQQQMQQQQQQQQEDKSSEQESARGDQQGSVEEIESELKKTLNIIPSAATEQPKAEQLSRKESTASFETAESELSSKETRAAKKKERKAAKQAAAAAEAASAPKAAVTKEPPKLTIPAPSSTGLLPTPVPFVIKEDENAPPKKPLPAKPAPAPEVSTGITVELNLRTGQFESPSSSAQLPPPVPFVAPAPAKSLRQIQEEQAKEQAERKRTQNAVKETERQNAAVAQRGGLAPWGLVSNATGPTRSLEEIQKDELAAEKTKTSKKKAKSTTPTTPVAETTDKDAASSSFWDYVPETPEPPKAKPAPAPAQPSKKEAKKEEKPAPQASHPIVVEAPKSLAEIQAEQKKQKKKDKPTVAAPSPVAVSPATTAPSAGWNVAAAKTPVKSLREIQADEQEKQKITEVSIPKPAPTPTKTASWIAPSAPVASPKAPESSKKAKKAAQKEQPVPEPAADDDLFWDYNAASPATTEPPKKAEKKKQQQQQPAKQEPKLQPAKKGKASEEDTVPPASKDFLDWCRSELRKLGKSESDLTLMQFMWSLGDVGEIRALIRQFMGSHPKCESFANEFLLNRDFEMQKMRKKGGGGSGESAPATSRAPVPALPGGLFVDEEGSKNKKKKAKKVDNSLLAFNVQSNRIMQGEIESLDQ